MPQRSIDRTYRPHHRCHRSDRQIRPAASQRRTPVWWSMLLCVIALSSAAAQLADSLTPVTPSRQASVGEFQTLEGDPFVLADHLGQATIVNFWATWCGPCIEELPLMEQTYRQWRDKGLNIIAVNAFDDTETINAFLNAFDSPLSFDFVRDPAQLSVREWDVSVLPRTYVLDRDGDVVFEAKGPRDFTAPAIQAQLETLLSPRQPSDQGGGSG